MLLSRFKACIILVMLNANLAHAETFTVVSDYWCPYNCKPNSELEGFGIDLLKQAFEAKGITVKYILKPWDRALAVVENNEYNAVMSANKTESTKLLYPDLYFSRSSNCFFIRDDNPWEFTGVQSINKIKLGVVKSYSYGIQIDQYLLHNRSNIYQVTGLDPIDQLMEKMGAGEIDAILEDRHVFQYQYSLLKSQLNITPRHCLPAANIYMAFAPDHPDTPRYMKIYDERMQVLLKSGTYKIIMERYRSQ
jgi:polar amino acid transport system substrate-binding protein